MAKRYIVQKREVKERNGRRPHLMGPYRTVYSDITPPFDLSDRDKIESNLLMKYGEGRYQVKSVGKDEGEERSKITVHFTGDIERYRPHSKEWTKEERVKVLRTKWRSPRDKIFALLAFFVLYLVVAWLFLASMGSGLDSSVTIVVVISMVVVFLAAAFFIDMMVFETE
jgi:hypothetical protein